MQCSPDAVVEQDEGLDDHLALGRVDRAEHARKEDVAVFEQLDVGALHPARATDGALQDPVLQDPVLHSAISATSGA